MEASALRRSRAVAPTRSRRLLAALGDDRLVDQLRRGNEVAFEVIYDRHHRGILAFCRHMLGSRDEAEDAVQHTFTSAYTDLLSNDREIRLKAWLYTIARNRCLSMLRARREQPAEIDDQPTAGLSEEVQRREDLRDLLHDLEDLPDDQREALVLFEVGDLSQAEVARVIGVDPMKVKALVFQARSSLIEKRDARAIPCAEIREQLATASGGALRRGPLRRHLRVCEGCSEYRDQVREQRSALALILPVVPTVGLKEGILSAIGFGGGAGGAGIGTAAGGAVGGGAALGGAGAGGSGLFASIAGVGGIKLAVAAAITGGGLIGGGVGLQRTVDDAGPTKAEAADTAEAKRKSAAGGGKEPGGATAAPAVSGNEGSSRSRSGDEREERKDDRDKDGKRDDDERGQSESRRGDDKRGGRGNGRKGGKARGPRGNGNPGSRRGGKSRNRGRRNGANNGRRPGKAPRGPKPPVGTTGGNTGSDGSSGSTSGTDATTTGELTGTEDTRESKPPRIETDTTGDDAPKPEPKNRVAELVPPLE